MRRALLLGAAAASALLAVAWARGGGGTASAPLPIRAVAHPTQRPPVSEDRSLAAGPSRNLFEYGFQGRPPKASFTPEPHDRRRAAAPEAPPAAPAVRLIGVVHRGEDILAAVSIRDEVVTLAPGEASSGYTLLAIDEDLGARFRGPSGDEFTASLAP